VDPANVTCDMPVPFDLKEVWYWMDYENNATYTTTAHDVPEVVKAGDTSSLVPTVFKPHGLSSKAPFKGTYHGAFGTFPGRLRLRMKDPRYQFLLHPQPAPDVATDPLLEVMDEWLGGNRPVSVLDFSGIPAEATDIAVGAVLGLLLEVALRSRDTGIGRPRPLLFVLEEAHRYLGEGENVRMARVATNRIAREGRKHGIGLVLVTQRPSELPDTALSQCGTIIALRLTNGADQGTVKAALPDSGAGLAAALPALRTGEAVVSGEAVILPSRVLVDTPHPQPDAQDPALASWRNPASRNDLADALATWRGMS